MIMFWNRKEIYMGNSMEKFYTVRDILDANHIKYTYSLSGSDSASIFASRRSVTGSPGENLNFSTMYYIYVDKKDYAQACSLLRK